MLENYEFAMDSLQTEGAVLASFVAECEKRIGGHILSSRM
jgi:hypothetical protein